jgi:hypothetical protein
MTWSCQKEYRAGFYIYVKEIGLLLWKRKKNDSTRLDDGTKEDHELQDYYNAQKI